MPVDSTLMLELSALMLGVPFLTLGVELEAGFFWTTSFLLAIIRQWAVK